MAFAGRKTQYNEVPFLLLLFITPFVPGKQRRLRYEE